MGEGRRGGTSKLREAARRVAVAAAYACGSFSRRKALVDPVSIDNSCSLSATVHFHFPPFFSEHYAFLSYLGVYHFGERCKLYLHLNQNGLQFLPNWFSFPSLKIDVQLKDPFHSWVRNFGFENAPSYLVFSNNTFDDRDQVGSDLDQL